MDARLQLGAFVVAGMVAAAMPARATDAAAGDAADRLAFLGLWEGVDPLDGSTVRASITDIDGDGILEMVQNESFFTYCARLGANFSQGRGLISGQGPVVRKRVQAGGRNIVRRVYAVVTSFTCISNGGTARPPLVGPFDYPLVEGGRILVVPGADAQTPDVLLHRTAP